MRVIAKRTLRAFYQQTRYKDAKGPLEAWHAEAIKAEWQTPHEIKSQIGSASIITDSLVVFNIAENKYRLVVDVDYVRQAMFVKFVGNHAEYDKLKLKGKQEDGTVDIRPIKTEQDYDAALAEIEALWGAEPDTPEGDKLDVLITLVEAYEARQHPIAPPDPVEAILFRIEQAGLNRKDLEPYIGHSGRVSEVLNRKRPLTLEMIRKLWKGLHIPLESLIQSDDKANHQQRA